jgi:hypothetical protein
MAKIAAWKINNMNFYPVSIKKHEEMAPSSKYYSVEFALHAQHPVYQFKLWRSTQKALFFLVKENSAVLSGLKVGNVMPMKYYSDETLHPTMMLKTQIHGIINETHGRFRGHCRIKLEIVQNTTQSPLH